MVKALIRMGDMTTHGGKVIEGFSDYTIQNIPVAGVGHKTICPLCKGVFPIIQGYGGITVNGIFVALEGHVTACGAKLIPSQHEEVVDDGSGNGSDFDNAKSIKFLFKGKDGRPHAKIPYTALMPDGSVVRGVTNDQGHTERFNSSDGGDVKVHLDLVKEKQVFRNGRN